MRERPLPFAHQCCPAPPADHPTMCGGDPIGSAVPDSGFDDPTSPITKLHDGSAFFTADVMPHDEAMALPPDKRPLNYRIASELYHATFEAIGKASTLGSPHPSYDPAKNEQLTNVAVNLCLKFADALDQAKADAFAAGQNHVMKLVHEQSQKMLANLEAYPR